MFDILSFPRKVWFFVKSLQFVFGDEKSIEILFILSAMKWIPDVPSFIHPTLRIMGSQNLFYFGDPRNLILEEFIQF